MRVRICAAALCAACIVSFSWLTAEAQKAKKLPAAVPNWIWISDEAKPNQTVYFRKRITLTTRPTSVRVTGTCDNAMKVFINDQEAVASDTWEIPVSKDVTSLFPREGEYVVAVEAHNTEGPAGLLLTFEIQVGRKTTKIVTDNTWRATEKPGKGWRELKHDDKAGAGARPLSKLGGGRWTGVNPATFAAAGEGPKATATPVEHMKIKKDFRIELLYTVPKATQGSWVAMCVDDKGRLITSDQYGKLYRVTPPPVGSNETPVVETIPLDIGEAHGLVWAFDSLYVVGNGDQGKKARGLYRVRSSKNNDRLDSVQKLREIPGGGEHGPHAVLIGPDGKSLYVIAGNHTPLIKTDTTLVPRLWGEHFILPRQWDASGHATGILAPGGWICKTDPDGKKWELVSIGYRNQYDAAFNRDGELFTYDSDMQWDMNTRWDRPTRLCHAVCGSEVGCRSCARLYA